MADKTYIWNDTFLNDDPNEDTGLVRWSGEYINDTRKSLTERLTDEHIWDPNEPAPQVRMGAHKQGSAMSFYGGSEPLFRPDGVTPLDADDAGRQWFDSSNGLINGWSGTAWVNLSSQGVGTKLRWQSTAQYSQSEIVEHNGILWVALANPPTIGDTPGEPDWTIFSFDMPYSYIWYDQHTYTAGAVVYYQGAFWTAIGPVYNSPPGAVPGEWSQVEFGTESLADSSVTTPKIADGNVTFAKLAPDTNKVAIWRADATYVDGDIINYQDKWWEAKVPVLGDAPAEPAWSRWTDQTSESVTNTTTVVAGKPDETVFCDTTVNPSYTVTIEDGINLGDKVTIAAFGGGEVIVVGTGLTDQTQTDTAIEYLWSGTEYLPLGGGGAGGGGAGLALGEVTWWGAPLTTALPAGKLVCNGAILNIADYAQLFGRIGTTWGGDGVTTFGLPNHMGVFPGAIGVQGTHGDAGNVVGQLVEDSFESHTHTQDAHNHTQDAHIHTMPTHRHTGGGAFLNTGTQLAHGSTTYGSNRSTANNNNTANNILPWTSTVNPGDANATTAVNQSTTGVNQNTGGTETRPASAMGQWLIQAEPPEPAVINAVVVETTIGSVRWWASETIDQYDLECAGQIINIATYPDLYAVLGTVYGGDGVTTFGLPNHQGIFPGARGVQGTHGNAGWAFGSLQEDSFESHAHTSAIHAHTIAHTHNSAVHQHGTGLSVLPGDENRVLHGARNAVSNQYNAFSSSSSTREIMTDNVTPPVTGGSNSANSGSTTPASTGLAGGTETRPASVIGMWVIRALQPAAYIIPNVDEVLPSVEYPVFGEPILPTQELYLDGTKEFVSSDGNAPVVDVVDYLPAVINVDGAETPEANSKWPGQRGTYGFFGEYENSIANPIINTNIRATVSNEGDWVKGVATTAGASFYTKWEWATGIRQPWVSVLIRRGSTNANYVIVRDIAVTTSCQQAVEWDTKTFNNTQIAESNSFFISDDLAFVSFKPNDLGVDLDRGEVYYGRTDATVIIGDYGYYKDLMFASVPYQVPYTAGAHQPAKLQFNKDWAESAEWTIQGWVKQAYSDDAVFERIMVTQDPSNIDNFAIGFTDLFEIYFANRVSGVSHTIRSAPVTTGLYHHIKATIGPAGTELFVNGVSVGTDPTTPSLEKYAKWFWLGSDIALNSPLTGYLCDLSITPGIDTSDAHYLSGLPHYNPNKTYGKSASWSIDSKGHISGNNQLSGSIIQDEEINGQWVTRWDTGRMDISAVRSSGEANPVSITFAVPFTVAPVVTATATTANSRLVTVSNISGTSGDFYRFVTSDEASSTVGFRYIATGRWK